MYKRQLSNAVVVATGDFEPDTMLAKIEGYFGALPGGPMTLSLIHISEPTRPY